MSCQPVNARGLRNVLSIGLMFTMLVGGSGCFGSSVPTFDPVYYEACFEPCRTLKDSEDALRNRTLIGMALGVGSGALVGVLAGGNTKGTVIGAISGLFVGGATAYVTGKMEQHATDKERFRSYQADMNYEVVNASRVEQYANISLQCYIREFKSLTKKYKAGKISQEEFKERYAEIRKGLNYISKMTDNAQGAVLDHDQEYRTAFLEEVNQKRGGNQTGTASNLVSAARSNTNITSKLGGSAMFADAALSLASSAIDSAAKSAPKAKRKEIVTTQKFKNPEKELDKISKKAASRNKVIAQRINSVTAKEKAQSSASEKASSKHHLTSVKSVEKYYNDQKYATIADDLAGAANMTAAALSCMDDTVTGLGIDAV